YGCGADGRVRASAGPPQVGAGRRVPRDVVRGDAHELRVVQVLARPFAAVPDPAVRLAAAVLEARARGRVRERVERGLHAVDRLVQVVVVHVADRDVQLAAQLRAELRPVAAQVVRQVVV